MGRLLRFIGYRELLAKIEASYPPVTVGLSFGWKSPPLNIFKINVFWVENSHKGSN